MESTMEQANVSTSEQRQDERTYLTWPVSVWMPQANRFFNGRSSNISKSGVFLSIPVTAPVKAGQILEINFPRTDALAKKKGSYSRIKAGTVVRVERRNMLQDANIGVAVRFE
jgi:hypothetical protein